MSLILYATIEYNTNDKLEQISDDIFKIMEESSKRKLALNVQMKFKRKEIYLEISNSYVFQIAEEILLDDYSIPTPPHIERLNNLQGLLECIYQFQFVNELRVYMCSDYYHENEFELIDCKLNQFARMMENKLFQKFTYAYKCVFTKQ